MMRSTTLAALLAAALLTTAPPAVAQPAVQALTTCVADATSGRDRKDLARWVFLAMSKHPEIQQYATPAAAAASEDSSRFMARLFTRLMTEACTNEVKAAVQVAGTGAIQAAFQNLGQLAMQELMSDKAVNESMSAFERHLDQKRIGEALGQ